MSPKFALVMLFLSCVLLGIARAQQGRHPQQRQYPTNLRRILYKSPNAKVRTLGGGFLGGDAFDEDCLPNELASGNKDNKKPGSKTK